MRLMLLVLCLPLLLVRTGWGEFRAGAAVVDVSPQQFPVLVNGGMLTRSADKVKTPVNARALALEDGKERIVMVVVDSCMMSRELLDDVKALAGQELDLPRDRILISATHTHSAPASMGCLGTNTDETYAAYLRLKLVEAMSAALENLEPAQVGWAVANAAEYTALRRWIRRPDRVAADPFGNPTVRANMHAANNWDDVIGESGPEDPDFSMISIQSRAGRPLAVLANFSMHYYSDAPISADYFGLFCEGLKSRVAPQPVEGAPPFVALLSHGCSGDIWKRDYAVPKEQRIDNLSIEEYTSRLVDLAAQALVGVEHRIDVDLGMAEARLKLNYRVPDKQRLEWAQRIVAEMGDRDPRTTEEVYAREQVLLHEKQSTEVVVQGLRLGPIAIATTPCETYALTGLKIKTQSPLAQTMVIELANGGDGYIPPPEQHLLGGYNTWAARSAGLEVQAEPRIAEAAIALLERVTGQPRRPQRLDHGHLAEATLKQQPAGYWRLDELAGPRAVDATAHGHDAVYEPGVVFYLPGPRSEAFCRDGQVNRSAATCGGRILARLPGVTPRHSVSMWIWNGMPTDGRDVTGWFLSRGPNQGLAAYGDHLGLGGSSGATGKLIYLNGGADQGLSPIAGRTSIDRWTWHHVLFVRDGDAVRIYLDGQLEIETTAPANIPGHIDTFFLGGRCDNQSNWEGRVDEAALFERALSVEEARELAGQ